MLEHGKVEAARTLTYKNLKAVEEAFSLFPEHPDFHTLLGYTLKDIFQSSKNLLSNERRQMCLERAKVSFEHALKLAPNSAGAHNGMGNIHFFSGNFDEAIKEHDIALKLSNNNYPAAEDDKQLVIRVKNGEIPFNF